MIKRYGVVVLLFTLSILSGIAIVVLDSAYVFFFSKGIFILSGIITVLLITMLIFWVSLKKPSVTRNPVNALKRQSNAFLVWYAAHNLFWAALSIYTTLFFFLFFGLKSWVIIYSTGAIACIFIAITGIAVIGNKEMLGLCWQSPVPDGLKNFWEHVGASLILIERYETAAEYDQQLPAPVLWSMSRIYNRDVSGGADRAVDLLDPRRGFLVGQMKKEARHRIRVLLIVFFCTVALSVMLQLLGIPPHQWEHVPKSWLSAKINKSRLPQPQQTMPRSDSTQTETDSVKGNEDKFNNTNKQNQQAKQENSVSKSNDNNTGFSNQKGSENANYTENKGQQNPDKPLDNNKKNNQSQSSANSKTGEQIDTSPGANDNKAPQDSQKAQSSQQSEAGDDKQNNISKNQTQKEGTSLDEKGEREPNPSGGANSKDEKDTKDNSSPSQENQANSNPSNKSSSEKSDQSDESSKGEGQSNRFSDREQSQDNGNNEQVASEHGQKGSKGKGGEAGDENSKEGDSAEGKKIDKNSGKGKNAGEGQGLGSPDDIPEMLNTPETLPQIPSRQTNMVTLELPTLMDNQEKNSRDQKTTKKNDQVKKIMPKGKAPISSYEVGKQERIPVKPEQYLPNWIVNLINLKEKKEENKNR